MSISKIKNITYFIKQKFRLVKEVSKLKIKNAGIDEEGDPFVKLENGPIFYSLKSTSKEKKYYSLLPSKIKKKLPFECYRTANDIVIRYIEGGLKLAGPEKERFYTVKKNDVIAEMGAYMGHFTIYLSEKAGNGGKVVAIEPIIDNLRLLRKNVKENNFKNVSIMPIGVWNKKDTLVFYRNEGDNQSASVMLLGEEKNKMELQVDTLDNILNESKVNHVNFMIIQLNGVEIEALEGLTKIKPENIAIAARYNKGKESAAKIISEMLLARNYKTDIIESEYVYARVK